MKKPSPAYYSYTVLASAVAGDLDYAVAVGREGMGLYPESGPILVNTGVVLERRGEIEAAEALYKRAVAVTPPPPRRTRTSATKPTRTATTMEPGSSTKRR